jgi:hypothetical protein
MTSELETAKTKLLSVGLHVVEFNPTTLNVWATEGDFGQGMRGTPDLSRLSLEQEGEFAVQFPGPGQCRYRMSGKPGKILALIEDVYANYRTAGGSLAEAFSRVVPDSEQYLWARPGR